jgi:hypothetical protein
MERRSREGGVMGRVSRKKYRKIVVEGKEFLWKVQGSSRYLGNTPTTLTITVQELADKPGRVAQAILTSKPYLLNPHQSDVNDGLTTHKASVYPRDVAKMVRAFLISGWNPSQKGSAFQFKGKLDLAEFLIG